MIFEEYDRKVRSIVNASTFPIEAEIDELTIQLCIKDGFNRGCSISETVRLIKLTDQTLDEDHAIKEAKKIRDRHPYSWEKK